MYDAQPQSAYHSQIPQNIVRPAPEYSVAKEAIPFWVKPASLPEDNSENPWILSDCQFNCELKTVYIHNAQKIENMPDAEQLANMQIPFHPYYQKLILHTCEIIREGRRLDRLDQAKIYVIQQEPELNEYMFMGELQAVLFLDDIRKGDLLEYSFSLAGCPFDRWGFRLHLQQASPINKMNLRIIKPDGRSFYVTHCNTPEEILVHETEEEYELTLEPCPAWCREAKQPAGYCDAPYVECTEFESWNEVVHEKLKFYELDRNFAFDSEALRLVMDWKNDSSNSEEAALKALRFVQDEIRYLALSIDDGGWNPANPSETLRRRYGDCKGKTQLFRAFLDLLGIPSTPVLVHTKQQGGIESYLPQPISNHVIVRVDLSDAPVYVDPTLTFQGGSLSESYLPYRKGLALSEKTQELSDIPSSRPEIDIDRTTGITVDKTGVTMTITSLSYGESANSLRWNIAALGEKKCAEALQDYYQELYGFTELISYDYQDDRDINRIQESHTLFFECPWSQNREGENYFPYLAEPLDYFHQQFDPDRMTPLSLPTPKKIRERLFLSSGGMQCLPREIEHPAFDFTATAASEREIIFELNSKLSRLDPEELEEYAEELYRGSMSCGAIIFELPKKTREAIQMAKILARP